MWRSEVERWTQPGTLGSGMKSLIHITRGLIRDTAARRWCMFVVVLVAAMMVFLGSTFLEGWLEEKPFVFLSYWLICAWLTLLSFLLAAYDLLMVRASGKVARALLKKRMEDHEDEPGGNP